MRAGIIKFDKMKIKEKLCFNLHTMELVGFVGGAIDDDVIKNEFDCLKRYDQASEATEDNSDSVGDAEHLLLFMFTTWDRK